MATFDGYDLGITESKDFPNPNREQLDAFPGVNGLARQNLGTAGGTVVIDATIVGPIAALVSYKAQLKVYLRDGASHTLLDDEGNTFAAYLATIEPTTRVKADSGGKSWQSLRLTFRYLD